MQTRSFINKANLKNIKIKKCTKNISKIAKYNKSDSLNKRPY